VRKRKRRNLMRGGSQYVESLDDGRQVYINGEKVRGVAEHPAFSGAVRTTASLYDTALDPSNDMVFTDPETGTEANKVFMIPRDSEDLKQRRQAILSWAKITNGLMGRSPDHVGNFIAGFASAPEVFASAGDSFANNVRRFYQTIIREDLYVTYTIIPPQVDRSKTAQGQEDAFTQVGAYEERDDGIIVRGAQMLDTGGPISDYLFVSCIQPLKPGDEDYAISFVTPIGTPGLKLYCRRPYAIGQPSAFDYPLSARFDESDALVVFEDVFVPWENVFVYRDVELVRDQFFKTPAHVLGNNQAQIRLITKLKFLIGVARKVAATNRIDSIPSVQEKLGDLASLAAIVEGMVLASEASPIVDDNGVAWPNPRFLYGAMGLQPELYPRVIHLLREIVGAGVIQVPSSYKELMNPETETDIKRYVRSPDMPSEERVKLFKLAWELVGSEFAGRHHQYELFYAGAPYVAKGYSYRYYGYEEPVELVESFLKTYSLAEMAAEEST
jgi:4-hydroxyphenylacetate 3-monooxygenase